MEPQPGHSARNEGQDSIQLNDIELALDEVEQSYGDQFPILDLPNEILCKLYPYFDHGTRKVLSDIARMEEMRKKVEISCNKLRIEVDHDAVNAKIALDGVERVIAVGKLENEIEQIGINRHFERVFYEYWKDDGLARKALKYVKAKSVDVEYIRNNEEFECVVQNKENVRIRGTPLNCMWIYKRMVGLTPSSELKRVAIASISKSEGDEFLKELGIEEDDWDPEFTFYKAANPKQMARAYGNHVVVIYERYLEIEVHLEKQISVDCDDYDYGGGFYEETEPGSIIFDIGDKPYEGREEKE